MDDSFSAQLRQSIIDLAVCPTCHQRRETMGTISRASNVPVPTLRRFLAGKPVRLMTVDRLIVFLRDNEVEVTS